MVQSQMSNLVNGVVTRSLAATDATNDRVGACGTKLHERVQMNTSGRPVYASLPVRHQFTSGAGTWQALKFLPREGLPAGNWLAPEELDTQVSDKQSGVEFQLFTSLLLDRRGWFANHALSLGC